MAGKSVAPYQQPLRHRRSPRHPQALSVLTCMLTGVTVIALFSLGSLFVAPQPLVSRNSPVTSSRFYTAANAMLAGGSPAALERVMVADLLDDHAGIPAGGRAVLVQRLTELRRVAPTAQMRVSAIVVEGEWAAARVTIIGLRPTVNGVLLELAPERTVQHEFFRIVDGRIAEYWPEGPVIDLPRALPPIHVAPWVTDTSVSLARLTFPSGATLHDLTAPGEHLFLLERGELDVSLSGLASLFDAARPEAGWHDTPASGQQLVLRTGDALLVPPHTRHTISEYRRGLGDGPWGGHDSARGTRHGGASARRQ